MSVRYDRDLPMARHYHEHGCSAESFAGPGCKCLERARLEGIAIRAEIGSVVDRALLRVKSRSLGTRPGFWVDEEVGE